MKKIELLAPAGGKTQYIAAVENGADCVYIGGTLYNARIGAGNFTADEMKKAIDYGHLRGVRTYVTMNTLIPDSELLPALGYARKLYEMGADALIIQDLGLGKLIHDDMPDFPLHLSTQATVYNRSGMKAAAKLGYSRIVLARELSLEEIRACTENGEKEQLPETEVFVHGAMCICYSGQCQLSRYIGGRSGNKGMCAQPCRLPYSYAPEGERAVYGCALSPKDLCMIDNLGELIKAGVSSLKIEGRMKSAEYVATVVRIYRKYIDLYYENRKKKGYKLRVSPEDRFELTQIFNRGGFTEGYAHEDPGEEFMSGGISKNQGILIGRIEKQIGRGPLAAFSAVPADMGPDNGIILPEKGDIIEVRSGGTGANGSDDTFSTMVTYAEKKNGAGMIIGDMKREVRRGENVYRISSAALAAKARESFAYTDFDGGRFTRRTPVNMVLTANCGSSPALSVSANVCGRKISCTFRQESFAAEEARSRASSEEELAAQLRKTGSTPFEAAGIRVITDGRAFIPVSAVNELRREALRMLEEEILSAFGREYRACGGSAAAVSGIGGKTAEEDESVLELRFADISGMERFSVSADAAEAAENADAVRILVPIRKAVEEKEKVTAEAERIFRDLAAGGRTEIIPYTDSVTRGPSDRWLSENAEAAEAGIIGYGGRVYVGNISHTDILHKDRVTMLADSGLNVYNAKAAEAYGILGVKEAAMSEETEDRGCGALPLMVTEHRMRPGILKDRKGVSYSVSFDGDTHKTVIASCAEPDWKNAGKRLSDGPGTVRIYI